MNTISVDGIKVHTHVCGEQGAFVSAYLIETPRGIVAVDGTLTLSESKRHREAILSLGKPLLGVLVTCPYPDHIAGLTTLVAGEDVHIYTTRPVLDRIRALEDPSRQKWEPMLGEEWIPSWTHPNRVVEDGQTITIDGVTFRAHVVGAGAEAETGCVWMLGAPSRAAFVGDLISHGMHAYVAERRLHAWLASLERAEALLTTCDWMLPGHGVAGSPGALIRWQRAYLLRYAAQIKELSRGRPRLTDEAKQELTARMEAHLPEGGLSFLVAMSADAVAAELSATNPVVASLVMS
jgi:glyoxylase-like metal-dependent hydrolase (beta-lactamase superfamily II)